MNFTSAKYPHTFFIHKFFPWLQFFDYVFVLKYLESIVIVIWV